MASDPGAQAAQVLSQSAANLTNSHKAAVSAAAQEAKKTLLNEASRVGGGRLRNVGRSGAKLGVGYEVSVTGSGGRAIVRARGPWRLAESAIRPHAIRPRKSRKKRALSFGGGAYARVAHPGVPRSRQPRPWEKGTEKAAPLVYKALGGQYLKAVAAAW